MGGEGETIRLASTLAPPDARCGHWAYRVSAGSPFEDEDEKENEEDFKAETGGTLPGRNRRDGYEMLNCAPSPAFAALRRGKPRTPDGGEGDRASASIGRIGASLKGFYSNHSPS